MDRRGFLKQAGLAPLALAMPLRGDGPVQTGKTMAGLVSFDRLMVSFIETNKVPGAALAVTRQGKLVYSRGFGYADVEKKEAVEPAALFRIASVSKPVTAVGILKLIENGKLKLDDKVIDHVKLKPHLDETAAVDARWPKITLRHLLNHTGGWDRDKSYDPITITPKIAKALKIEYPVRPDDVCRYMMGQPLDFDPGERYSYSNLGYLLLGRVIENATGRKYEEYVKKEILAPLGITTMQLGRALLENRVKGEVKYYDSKNRTGPALYGPDRGRLPITYGGSNLEGYEAHGGWIASAPDLVRFASAFNDPKRCPILKPETIAMMCERPPGLPGRTPKGMAKAVFYACGWNVRPHDDGTRDTWHSGLIGGTSTLLLRRGDGVNWAVLFNMDHNAENKVLSALIDPLIHEAADAVKSWPK